MPSINNQPVLPGIYDQVQQQLLASVTGGIRTVCYIGTGRLTNLVTGEAVTRGSVDTTANVPFTVTTVTDATHLIVSTTAGMSALDTIVQGRYTTTITTVTDGTHLVVDSTTGWAVDTNNDALSNFATVLDGSTITDANYAVYDAGFDYSATPVSGGIGWLSNVASLTGKIVGPYAGLVGTTLQIAVAGTIQSSYTFVTSDFVSPSAATATEVATAIVGNHALTGTVDLVNGNAAVVGTSTLFLTELSIGSIITDSVTFATVLTITDDTHLSLSAPWSGSTDATASISRVGFTGITSVANAGAVEISTVATFNTSLTIENGTANTILGFVAGSLVSAPSRPALGVTYYANYEWAKAIGDGQGSFQPQFYFVQNFATITNAIGSVGGGAGDVVNTANMNGAWTLPIAAQLAQLNGASIVCLLQMNPADGSSASQVRAALQKLFIPNINIVVSLAGDVNYMLIPDITAHVETASSTINRLERTAFIGFAANDSSFTDMTTMLGYATAASSNRVVIVNQTSTTYSMFIGTSQTASVVDGTMMAASLAALRTNPAYDVAQPLTREVVSGIATTNTLAQAAKVILSNGGVLIVDNISGSAKVVFGTTSEFDTILNQLYQVTEITDYCAQTLRGLLDPIFIGQKLLTNTPSQVETVSGAIMQTIEDANIIESFVNPTATVNPSQPTQILLQVGIQPVLELDTILITLGLNLA